MKISDKLATVEDSFTVHMYDNGFMVEVGGRDKDDNWKTVKLTFAALDQVQELVEQVVKMPRNN